MRNFANFFKQDWQFFHYTLIKRINGFWYFLGKIPVLNKMFDEKVYRTYELKRFIGIVLIIWEVVFSFLKKILIMGLAILLQLVLQTFFEGGNFAMMFSRIDQTTIQKGIFLWLFTIVIFGGFFNHFSVTISKKAMDFYTEFALSRNHFILGQEFANMFKHTMYYLGAALLCGLILQKSTIVFFILFSYLACQLALFVFCRSLYMHYENIVTRRFIGLGVTVLFLGLLSTIYKFDQIWLLTKLFTSSWCLLVWLILASVGFYRAWYYPKQPLFIQKVIAQSVVFYDGLADAKLENNEYISKGLNMQKQLHVNHDQRVEKLTGTHYLNALLFSRYQHVFLRKIRYLIVVFVVIAISLVGLRIANIQYYLSEKDALRLLPILFFVMYGLSFGKQIVQMVFVNCDVSMLYYPFYRESHTILEGFNYRFRQIMKYNSIIIVGIFLLFFLLQVLNDFYLSWSFFGVLLLLLSALGLLFSFHELFVYYLLQPFTADMTVQSPTYRVVTWLFYFFSYINTRVTFPGFFYVIAISFISIAYVVIGLVIIYFVAPRTFKIKE
ncbi:hypothetical protein [Enterococcus bulliens]